MKYKISLLLDFNIKTDKYFKEYLTFALQNAIF